MAAFLVYAHSVKAKGMPGIGRLPLLWPVAAWVAGIGLARADLFPVDVALTLFVILFGLLLQLHRKMVALILCVGLLWGIADLFLDARRIIVEDQWLADEKMITATVEKVESRSAYVRLQLGDVRDESGQELPGLALLYLYGKEARRQLVAGQKIRARVRWRLPRNYLNPGAFDYRAWCFDRHIALIGSLRGDFAISGASVGWLEPLRQRIREAVASSGSEAGILHALLLADRTQVSERANAAFSSTGTAHLLAISGMHIGMAAAWMFVFAWWLLTRFESWIVRIPVRAAALSAGCLAAIAYATLAGWPLPAIRASLMLMAAVLAWWLALRTEAVNTLLAALALILLFDPSAISSLSLWLSFAATAAILLWAGMPDEGQQLTVKKRVWQAMKSIGWISILATLATLPMIVSTFGRLPLFSLPANLILVPLYGLMVMPLALLGELAALCGFDLFAAVMMQLSGSLAQVGLMALEWISSLPAGQLWAIKPPLWAGLLYVAGMLLVGWLYWQGKKLMAASGLLLVLALFSALALSERDVNVPTWAVWDVGQGAASTLLLPGNRVIVIDAPGRRGSRFNGGTIMASSLRDMGITHIDLLVLSHAQSDHLGGAMALLRSVNGVGQIWLPDTPDARADARVREIIVYAESRRIPVRWLAAGEQTSMSSDAGQLELTALWPPRSYVSSNANNLSLVLSARLEGYFHLLWPGDIAATAETQLLKRDLQPVSAMLMPHHGSATSSRSDFIHALRPGLAVSQTGFGNHYGFPNGEVVKRYHRAGAQIFDTAAGAVFIKWPGSGAAAMVSQQQSGSDNRRDRASRIIRRWGVQG